MSTFCIKAKINDKTKYVQVEDNLDQASFISTVLNAFEIDPDMDAKISIYDGDDVPIEVGQFEIIVNQFKNCNHFIIKIVICADSSESHVVCDLRQYLYNNKCAPLFIEFEQKQKLEPDSLQFLSDRLFQYVCDKYSIEDKKNIEDVVDAALTIFPNIKKVCIIRLIHTIT